MMSGRAADCIIWNLFANLLLFYLNFSPAPSATLSATTSATRTAGALGKHRHIVTSKSPSHSAPDIELIALTL